MSFFKANSYDIVKIYITQIGISIFSTMMYLSAGMIKADSTVAWWISLIISIFATGFFFALLYCTAWEWGGKDKIRADGGKIALDTAKGLKMGLIGNIPNFIFTVIAFVAFIICNTNKESFIGPAGAVCSVIIRFTASMYQGIVENSLSFLKGDGYGEFIFYIFQSAFFFVLALVSVLAVHIGYVMGAKETRILGIFKSKKTYE